MKINAALRSLQLALLLGLCGCASTPGEPPWAEEARKITVGMTRAEAEAHLPSCATIDTSFGSSGNHRDFYSVGENWRVTLVYRAPWTTNSYVTEVLTNGREITHGTLHGWTYEPTTNQPVVAGPFISYVKSRKTKFTDPFGSSTAKVPIKREP